MEERVMKRTLLLAVAAVLLSAVVFAQKPVRDISHKRHPNLAAAQRLTQQAWEKIGAAQQANEFDMQGHARKARELLDQANNELKLAAEAANEGK
jgi:hypothetical protein